MEKTKVSPLKYRQKIIIDCWEWDRFVSEVYQRPYCFQQQDGCQARGTVSFEVPGKSFDNEQNDYISDHSETSDMCVKFSAWLARDPQEGLIDTNEDWVIQLWWKRNFYPELQAVANDLHSRGILPAGEYTINIDG